MKEFNFGNVMLLIIIIGIVLMIFQWARDTKSCPKPRVLYRYIPRDFNLDSTIPDGISYKFKTMFENPTPYIVPLGNNNSRQLTAN